MEQQPTLPNAQDKHGEKPDVHLNTPEKTGLQNPQEVSWQYEQLGDTNSSLAQNVPLVAPVQSTTVTNTTVNNTDDTTADDVDVIEKAWVDKAKRIVEQTKDNPYEQEKRASELQADYLKRRYGKEIEILK